ncbi:MAG TPA: hypothetical protein VJZ00_04380 [Thermoanaerobaculia bacterium]|nr:hypothetical protein [Thermoanaerobaculia bacterium]
MVFTLSCARMTPWRNEPIGDEVNLAFRMRENLIELQTVRLDNRPGRFLLGTAAPRTAIDPHFLGGRASTLQMGEKNAVRISPVALDLGGTADAIIGADAWKNEAITIDYRAGIVTFQKYEMERAQMAVFRYRAEPAVNVSVNGNEIAAVVDTSSPDTLVLPRETRGRGTVHVRLAGVDFGAIDVQYANVTRPRIGNRLLSHFLVTVDYGKHVVGLWSDSRGA